MHNQTIGTKFVFQKGVTPAHIVAIVSDYSNDEKCERISIIIKYDKNVEDHINHARAAKTLATELNWKGKWIGGDLGRFSKYDYLWVNITELGEDETFEVV
jgi:hypothetical protein